jgi:hypothetical protein
MKNFGFPLDPKEVRKLLTISGMPQEGLDTDQNIGPLVNLRNAVDKMWWDCHRHNGDSTWIVVRLESGGDLRPRMQLGLAMAGTLFLSVRVLA